MARSLEEWRQHWADLEERDAEGLPPRYQDPESEFFPPERPPGWEGGAPWSPPPAPEPEDISWERAVRIQSGEEEEPRYVTPTGYLKQKLAYPVGLVRRLQRSTGETFIDESGRVVSAGGRPAPTLEEQAGVASEVAGFGVGLAQGPGVVKTMIERFVRKYGREPKPAEVNAMVRGFDEWAATQPKTPASPEVASGLRAMRAERDTEVLQNVLDKLRRDKAVAAERPPPRDIPGPTSDIPRQLALSPGSEADVARAAMEEQARERGRFRAQPPPKRVIEAPPFLSMESVPTRELIRQEQGAVLGELPFEPTARVVVDPAMRDIQSGRVAIAPRERPPTGVPYPPAPLPKETLLGPSRAEKMGRLGWTREVPDGPDDATFVFRDAKGVTQAELIEVEVPPVGKPDGNPTTAWKAVGKDGKEIGVFTSPEEAAEGLRPSLPTGKPRFYPPIAGGSDMPDFKPRRSVPPPSEGPAVPGSVPGRPQLPDPIPPPDQRPLVPPVDGPPPLGQYITPSPDPMEPYALINRAYRKMSGGDIKKDIAELKSVVGLSTPADIAKAFPAYSDLIWETKRVRQAIEYKQNDLIHTRKQVVKAVGPDEFSRLMKLQDEGKQLDTSPEVAKLIQDIHTTVFNYGADIDPTGIFKAGYENRLKQSQRLRGVKAVDVDEYVTADARRIVPGGEEALAKGKLAEKLTGDKPYTVENVDRMIRASARASEIGTKLRPGYMENIKPFLAKLAGESDIIKREVDDYVNYFIGAPGARSPHVIQRWADRLRAFQFSSKIAGNLTSPVWNAGQNLLTASETDLKSFGKAWAGVLKHYNSKLTGQEPDKDFTALLKRLGVDREFDATSSMSDIGAMPVDTMTSLIDRFDRGLASFNDVMGMPFRVVEANNRTIAALSGYYDGVARNLPDADAVTRGKKVMDKTQFPGGEADMPRLFRSARGGVAGQFKTFTVKYGEYMKDNAWDAIKAATPGSKMDWQDRKDAIRKFTKFWGSQMAMGGVGSVPFIGDYLEEQLKDAPMDVHKGLGGMIGLDLTRQFGVGVIPIKRFEDLMYNIPGPTFNAAQDMLSVLTGKSAGDGLDFTKRGRDLTWDEWERKLVRMLPAGVQAAREIEALKIALSAGEKGGVDVPGIGRLGLKAFPRKAVTWQQAVGAEKPSGFKMSEVQRNALLTALGLRGTDVERESEILREESEHTNIENRAKAQAAELMAAGKRDAARDVLRRAEKKLDMKPNTLQPSLRSIRNAERKMTESPIERLRREKAKKGVRIPLASED